MQWFFLKLIFKFKKKSKSLLKAIQLMLVFSFTFSTAVFAQQGTSVKSIEAKKVEQVSNWSIPLTIEAAETLHTNDDYAKKSGISIEIKPIYKINKELKLTSILSASKEYTGEQRSELDNWSSGLTYSRLLSSRTVGLLNTTAFFPTDNKLREETTYQGSASIGAGFNFQRMVFGSELLTMLSYKLNFYEFSQDFEGRFNIRESATALLGFSVPLWSEKVSFESTFRYGSAWSFAGTQSYKFVFDAGFTYAPTEKLSFSIGTNNEGNALKSNGTDSNIELYNAESSAVRMGFTYLL